MSSLLLKYNQVNKIKVQKNYRSKCDGFHCRAINATIAPMCKPPSAILKEIFDTHDDNPIHGNIIQEAANLPPCEVEVLVVQTSCNHCRNEGKKDPRKLQRPGKRTKRLLLRLTR